MRQKKRAPADDGPLVALMLHVELRNDPPPPELLSALLSKWKEYLVADGALSLEDALIGRAPQKAGNYSKRWRTKIRDSWICVEVRGLMRRHGLSQEEAAEKLIRDEELDLEVDTVVTIARDVSRGLGPNSFFAPKRKPREAAK